MDRAKFTLALRRQRGNIIVILALVIFTLFVLGYLLNRQNTSYPSWFPFIGKSTFTLKGEFVTAQSVAPGQGQTVTIAGVNVGKVSNVEVKNGRAVVTMAIDTNHDKIYADATLLLRPKTGFQDMVVQMNPGSPAAPRLHSGATIPVQNTMPNVNIDQILAGLDADTRQYLQLLINNGGEALGGQGEVVSADLRRLGPINRDLLTVTRALAKRRKQLKRLITNFSALAVAVGEKDKQLASLVSSSDKVFGAIAAQDASLASGIKQLPQTLEVAQTSLKQVDRLTDVLGPTLNALEPTARNLAGTLSALQPFFAKTGPIIKNRLIPFTQAALPTATSLASAARDLGRALPDLTSVVKVVNEVLNEFAFNPPGKEEGFLFFVSWSNHTVNSIESLQDANGAIRRALTLVSCPGLALLETLQAINPQVNMLLTMVNVPKQSEVCSSGG